VLFTSCAKQADPAGHDDAHCLSMAVGEAATVASIIGPGDAGKLEGEQASASELCTERSMPKSLRIAERTPRRNARAPGCTSSLARALLLPRRLLGEAEPITKPRPAASSDEEATEDEPHGEFARVLAREPVALFLRDTGPAAGVGGGGVIAFPSAATEATVRSPL